MRYRASIVARWRDIAADWRERDRSHPAGGFVIVAHGDGRGWSAELGAAKRWVPGCVAVPAEGTCFVAMGGDAMRGAAEWRPVEET